MLHIFLEQYFTSKAVFKDHYPKISPKIGSVHQYICSWRKGGFTVNHRFIYSPLDCFFAAVVFCCQLRISLFALGIFFPNCIRRYIVFLTELLAAGSTFVSLNTINFAVFQRYFWPTIKALFLFIFLISRKAIPIKGYRSFHHSFCLLTLLLCLLCLFP